MHAWGPCKQAGMRRDPASEQACTGTCKHACVGLQARVRGDPASKWWGPCEQAGVGPVSVRGDPAGEWARGPCVCAWGSGGHGHVRVGIRRA